jgi:hypothetical protein
MTPLHNWEPIKHKGKCVIAWKCTQCGASVGRHFADWSEDKPPVVWLEATGIGEECKVMATKLKGDPMYYKCVDNPNNLPGLQVGHIYEAEEGYTRDGLNFLRLKGIPTALLAYQFVKVSEPMALPEPKIEATNWAFIMVVGGVALVFGWMMYLIH